MSIFIMGIVIGLTLGLTGSGGALVAIPLSMSLLDYSLKEATSFSLIAVFLSGSLNSIVQRKSVRWYAVLWILLFSLLGSSLFLPLKTHFSNALILFSICIVSLFGIWSVWSSQPKIQKSEDTKKDTHMGLEIGKYALVGILMGALTTLTGLGGGMILVPLYMYFLKLTPEEAIASSLVPISITALYSLVLQIATNKYNINIAILLPLFIGILSIALILQILTLRLASNLFQNFRRVFFSLIVILSLSKIIGDIAIWK